MALLAQGNWQTLGMLTLEGNNMSVLGLELLMTGQWPQLDSMTLDIKLATTATWALLHLSPEALCRVEKCTGCSVAPRLVSITLQDMLFGPCLHVCNSHLGAKGFQLYAGVSITVWAFNRS